MTSCLDLFTIGIGPSSSHTVGPMRAARRFAGELRESGKLAATDRVQVTLFGSLALTGKGHGTPNAILLGLEGAEPESVDPGSIAPRAEAIGAAEEIALGGEHRIGFRLKDDLLYERRAKLPLHPNGMLFTASANGDVLAQLPIYSTGGGFIATEEELKAPPAHAPHPLDFGSGSELLDLCAARGESVADLMLAREIALRPAAEVRAKLAAVVDAMRACVARGLEAGGCLPGGFKVQRRAAALYRQLQSGSADHPDPLEALDWVDAFALAVSEENAAGGRVVTAPTNGAAGIIPAVLEYALRFRQSPHPDAAARFLLTAAAIAVLYKKNASLSGADVGCQGEVGVACSMAAAALCEFLGGTPAQVENAAEIGMEHNLGLTCDPVGGLVQIPCIERNAMGAVKAINAARLALRGDGSHAVSLDKVIKTMRDTGRDMKEKYKETSRGGLAVNIVEC
ncbi:MAG: L-serine ammonia-lyase [Verrucomicrobiales bacterium]